jgi:hypothetical protein
MTTPKEYVVQVIVRSTNEVEHEIGPTTYSRAERIQEGMWHNLNHDRFFTTIVEAKAKKESK